MKNPHGNITPNQIITIVTLLITGAILLAPIKQQGITSYNYCMFPVCGYPPIEVTYLDGSEIETSGSINNAVGCPVEIDRYVPFRPILEHSKISKGESTDQTKLSLH